MLDPAVEPNGLGWSESWYARGLRAGRGRMAGGVLLILLVAFHVAFEPDALARLRLAAFDQFQRLAPRQVTALPVAIIDIDEASIQRFGQWPWPRTRLAQLVGAIGAEAPLAIGLDILMPEPDRLSPDRLLALYPGLDPTLAATLSRQPSNDRLLADMMARLPVVAGNGGIMDADPNHPPQDVLRTAARVEGSLYGVALLPIAGVLQNVAEIEGAAAGHGILNTIPDRDGVVRRVPLVARMGDALIPSLATEMLRVALGAEWFTVNASDGRVGAVTVGEARFATDGDGWVRIRFSPPDARRRFSAVEAFDRRIPAEAIRDKLVLIGVTALGLTDAPPTPIAARMDGVEIQAQAIENLVTGATLSRPAHARALEAGALVAAGLGLLALQPAFGVLAGTALLLALLLAIGGGAFGAFHAASLLLDPTFVAAALVAVYGILVAAAFTEADHRRRELSRLLVRERIDAARMAGELGAARDIQLGILPQASSIPGVPAHLELGALIEPAREVGGDLYDFFMLDERRLFFIVGDVTGKGVPASLFMALSKAICKSAALRGTLALDEIVVTANREIARDNPAMLFVTALMGILDTDTGVVDFTIAGHDAPISIRPGEPAVTLLGDGGPPLCVVDDFPYPVASHRLIPGEALVIVTDGITEAMRADGTLFGAERTLASLSAAGAEAGAEGLVARLVADVKDFVAGAPPSDDLTVVALRYRGGGGTGAVVSAR